MVVPTVEMMIFGKKEISSSPWRFVQDRK